MVNIMTKVQYRTALIINAFKAITNEDVTRLETAKQRLADDIERAENGLPTDCGLYGKVKEILSQSKHAGSKDVHKANEIDGYIYIDGVRYSLEHKTNYSNIQKFIDRPVKWQQTHLIHYTIDDITREVINKKTGHVTPSKRLYFDGVLTFYDFFKIGQMFNAIKPNANSKHGTNDIYFRHSLKMCKYLNSLNIVPFERNGRYTADDFIIEW